MNANNEHILYVKLSPTLASFHHCKLPSHIISSHGLQFIESLVVVEIIASNDDNVNVDIGYFCYRVLLPGSNLVEAFKRA